MEEPREEPQDEERELVVAPDDEVPFHVPRD
jgi:hypothetical protein